MIESGSHAPGVDAAAFGLPRGTALRYERPAPALAPLLPTYAVLDSDRSLYSGAPNWMLPGWAQIWIVLAQGPITVAIRNRRYDPLGSAVLYGVTSRAMPVTAQGGVTVVVDVSPLGWARLFAPSEQMSAQALRDRITPLAELVPDWADALVDLVHRSDRGPAVKGLLDDFFLSRLPPPAAAEPLVAQIAALLVDEDGPDLGAAAAGLGIAPQALLRLTKRYFGFPPKVLMRRARFLRALTGMLLAPPGAAPPALRGYHDASHFIRDGQHFLGTTPRRFAAQEMPYLRAALRARTLVAGAPTPALDRVGTV